MSKIIEQLHLLNDLCAEYLWVALDGKQYTGTTADNAELFTEASGARPKLKALHGADKL